MVVVLLSAISAACAFDGQYTLLGDTARWGTAYNGEIGGEFQLNLTEAAGSPKIVRGVTPHSGNWTTFCAQLAQNITYTTYDYTIALETDNAPPIDRHQLTQTAAWLYHQWNAGVLGQGQGVNAYDYADGAGRVSSAADLMSLLWNQMGELPTLTLSSRQAKWLQDAQSAVQTPEGLAAISGVRILQANGSNQDLFAEVTPEPGTLALLAIGGLPVLPMIRRRRRSLA